MKDRTKTKEFTNTLVNVNKNQGKTQFWKNKYGQI